MARGGWIRSLVSTALRLVGQACGVDVGCSGHGDIDFVGSRIGEGLGWRRSVLLNQGTGASDVERVEDRSELCFDFVNRRTAVQLRHAPELGGELRQDVLGVVLPPLLLSLTLLRSTLQRSERLAHAAVHPQRDVPEHAAHDRTSEMALTGLSHSNDAEGLWR